MDDKLSYTLIEIAELPTALLIAERRPYPRPAQSLQRAGQKSHLYVYDGLTIELQTRDIRLKQSVDLCSRLINTFFNWYRNALEQLAQFKFLLEKG